MSIQFATGIHPDLGGNIFKKVVTLSRRRAIIIASKFEKLLRAWFCSDQRQISAEIAPRTLYNVKKKFLIFFQK
jgi:hypothetical protein